MGQASRHRPARLAEKLLHVRAALGLSQNELISRLGLSGDLTQARISAYERGMREPPLVVLLNYARAANISVDALIDDELALPDKLPPRRKNEGVIIKQASKATPRRNSKS
jgi:transcriptional regulator with XRE-family HTH domain